MSNRILISVQDGRTEPKWINDVEGFCQKVMSKLNFDGEEVSILFCNDTYIQELNKNYRNIDSATDVLSFENDEEYEDEEGTWCCVGDIAISLDMLPVNAVVCNTPQLLNAYLPIYEILKEFEDEKIIK